MATAFWDMEGILLIEYMKKTSTGENCHAAKKAPQL
jgi:hypothetical protein